MATIRRISVTSKYENGMSGVNRQLLKDYLTSTEKKILIHMINAELNEGQVRNKIFNISKTGNNTAEVVIGTITKSVFSGRNEITKHRVKIEYS